MLIESFPAGDFETNCYVLAADINGPCVIVDPGQRASDRIAEVVKRHRLVPEAVLATHGHMDHTWDVEPVCRQYGIPVHVHPLDRPMLTQPTAGLPADFPRDVLRGYPGVEPDEVAPLPPPGPLVLGGLSITAVHAPGHTFGSVVFLLEGERPIVLTGDTLLATSVGRAVHPIGDPAELVGSVTRICAVVPDHTGLLPGHGPTSTIGAARKAIGELRR
ncbi:MAG: hydrolase [Dactylosporangium sp.]|nr:hydrolase [Dactylosporangium sp.]